MFNCSFALLYVFNSVSCVHLHDFDNVHLWDQSLRNLQKEKMMVNLTLFHGLIYPQKTLLTCLLLYYIEKANLTS